MTVEDIEYLNRLEREGASVNYSPKDLADWQTKSNGRSLPKGLSFGERPSYKFNCPLSTFAIVDYGVDHMGNGYNLCQTPKEAVAYLKSCLGTEDGEKEKYLSQLPSDLEDRLLKMEDDDQIEGESDYGCKWAIWKDVRVIHSDDLWRYFDHPALVLCETVSGADSIIVESFDVTYVATLGIVYSWKYPTAEALVSSISKVVRINDESSLIKDLTKLGDDQFLSYLGCSYSDNEKTILTLGRSRWRIDRKGKTLLKEKHEQD